MTCHNENRVMQGHCMPEGFEGSAGYLTSEGCKGSVWVYGLMMRCWVDMSTSLDS